jgi:hypothetical protein
MTWLKKFTLLFVMFFLVASPAFAAGWTISQPEVDEWANGQKMFRITIAYVQPSAAAGAETTLKTEMHTSIGSGVTEFWIDQFNGGVLYEVVTNPAAAGPDATYTLAFDCELGGSLLDLAAQSATVTEHVNFAKDLGYNPVFWNDLQIDPGDLGSTSDATTIYIYIVK